MHLYLALVLISVEGCLGTVWLCLGPQKRNQVVCKEVFQTPKWRGFQSGIEILTLGNLHLRTELHIFCLLRTQ